MPFAVLMVALIQAAEDDHIVGLTGFRYGLVYQHLCRAVLRDATSHCHIVVTLHGVAHVTTGIVAFHAIAGALCCKCIQWQNLVLGFQR